jgi:DUF971 family protein
MSSRPSRISVTRSTGKLNVEWDDGQHCEYSLSYLRAECPCAECRGAHETEDPAETTDNFELPVVDPSATSLDRIEKVGDYAIQLHWKDGHSHGIYSWNYLRSLCPELLEES